MGGGAREDGQAAKEEGQAFARKAMGNPIAGLSWAEAVLGQEPGAAAAWELEGAMACVAMGSSSWPERAWSICARARQAGLARAPGFAPALARIWEREHAMGLGAPQPAGLAGWARMLCRQAGPGSGVSEAAANELAEMALANPAMGQWRATWSPEAADRMLVESCQLADRAPEAWQCWLAEMLPPKMAWERVRCLAWREGGSSAPAACPGMSARAARVLASKALEDPAAARAMVRSLLMDPLPGPPNSSWDALAGVMEALAANPRPAFAPEPAPLPKVVMHSKAPLSLAMELMCAGRAEAGLFAARWAAALGGAGRAPSPVRTDGSKQRKFEMAIRVVGGDSHWGRGMVGVGSLMEAAIAMRDPRACSALMELGWGLPRKEQAHDLAKRVAAAAASARPSLGSASGKPIPPRPLWSGAGSLADAEAGTLAFWESMGIGRALAKSAKPAAPAKPAMRM